MWMKGQLQPLILPGLFLKYSLLKKVMEQPTCLEGLLVLGSGGLS